MNRIPPTRRAGRPRGSRSGAPAAGVLAVLISALVVALAGCATNPPPPAPSSPRGSAQSSGAPPTATSTPSASGSATSDAAGLVIAAVEGASSLGLVGSDGRLTPLAAPERAIRQLRARSQGLVAVLDDGTVALANADGSAWSIAAGIAGVAAVAIEPSEGHLALLGTDRLGSGKPLVLGITGGAKGPARSITSQGLEANGGPSWLADGRIVLRALAAGEKDVVAFVDPTTGAATTTALDGIDIFASRDGATVAIPSVGTLRVGGSRDVAAAMHGTSVETPTEPSGGQLADVALDSAGGRIAYVWADADGMPLSIRICTSAAGWRETSRLDIPPGASRVLLAWTR